MHGQVQIFGQTGVTKSFQLPWFYGKEQKEKGSGVRVPSDPGLQVCVAPATL